MERRRKHGRFASFVRRGLAANWNFVRGCCATYVACKHKLKRATEQRLGSTLLFDFGFPHSPGLDLASPTSPISPTAPSPGPAASVDDLFNFGDVGVQAENRHLRPGLTTQHQQLIVVRGFIASGLCSLRLAAVRGSSWRGRHFDFVREPPASSAALRPRQDRGYESRALARRTPCGVSETRGPPHCHSATASPRYNAAVAAEASSATSWTWCAPAAASHVPFWLCALVQPSAFCFALATAILLLDSLTPCPPDCSRSKLSKTLQRLGRCVAGHASQRQRAGH